MFADPQLFAKLAANPRTAKHLADPAFMQKLQLFQQHPQMAESAIGSDPRMIDVLGALMGIDMQGFAREEGSDELPPGVRPEQVREQPPRASSPPAPAPAAASSSKSPEPPKQEEDVEMLDSEEAEKKKAAEGEKKLGAEAYKARDFDGAIGHFQKAWDIYPKDIAFLTNVAGACGHRCRISPLMLILRNSCVLREG